MNMMIVIIRVTAYPNKRQELKQSFESLVRKMRKEQGCLSLHFSSDIEEKNTFYCMEHWQKQEDMSAHFRTELFTVLLGGIELLCESQDMQVYTVSRRSGKEVIDAARNDMNDMDSFENTRTADIPVRLSVDEHDAFADKDVRGTNR